MDRRSPRALLAWLSRPLVAGYLTVLAFAISSNFKWGVSWAWHFVAAAVFYAALIGIGRVADRGLPPPPELRRRSRAAA